MQENYTCDVAELLRQQTEKANLPSKSLMSWKNLSQLLRRRFWSCNRGRLLQMRKSFIINLYQIFKYHPYCRYRKRCPLGHLFLYASCSGGYAPLKQEIT